MGDDWAAQTAEGIERVVGAVRDKTAVPLDRAARYVVYGLVTAVLGLVAAVLLAVAAVRGLDRALPGNVWGAHATTSGIFLLAGLFLWSRRRARSD